jgi:hypothetical protein
MPFFNSSLGYNPQPTTHIMHITAILLGQGAKRIAPRALREQIWITHIGRHFEGKCVVSWCKNQINVFTFQAGHNVPYSKGGLTTLSNMKPICGACNKGMGNQYTIDEWSVLYK